MLGGIVSQVIWITFAPILPIVENIYHVTQSDIGLLSAVFPLTFIFLALPSGYYIDSKGFRKGILIGLFFLSVFGFLRSLAPNFLILLILQTIASFGQPFIFNSISKLVKSWFSESEEGLATGLGSLSTYLGIIIGLTLTPIFTLNIGYEAMMYLYGVFSILTLILFYYFGKEPPYKASEKEYLPINEFLSILKNRNILLLSLLAFLGVGIFTAYTTWVEVILEEHSLGVEIAGEIGGLMIIGGILGSIVIPALSDRIGNKKMFMLTSLLLSALLFYAHTMIYDSLLMASNLFILGFFFMATLLLALEMSADSVEKRYMGSANSALWLFSQIGSLILIVAFEETSRNVTWNNALLLSSILLILPSISVYFVKEE